jgi:hypothetical protein
LAERLLALGLAYDAALRLLKGGLLIIAAAWR